MLIIDLKPLAFGSGIRFLRDIFLLLPIWPVFPLGRPSFHHLGLRSSGPCWTGHALASSLQALLSPQSSLKSHLNFLRLNSLFADFAPAACLQALCLHFLSPQNGISPLLNRGCPCFAALNWVLPSQRLLLVLSTNDSSLAVCSVL